MRGDFSSHNKYLQPEQRTKQDMIRLIGAAALALLATTAHAQLMLPPPPPTAEQTSLLNLSMVATYTSMCKRNDRQFDPYRDVEIAIDGSFNLYPMSYRYEIMAARNQAFEVVEKVGGAIKFCEMADKDTGLHAAVERLRAMGANRANRKLKP
jgi:hypothetical protein